MAFQVLLFLFVFFLLLSLARLGHLYPTGCATSCTSRVKWLERVFDGIRVFCDEEALLRNYKHEWNNGRSQEVDKGSFPS